MRYSLTPTYHRSVLTFLELLSRRDLSRVLLQVKEVLSPHSGTQAPAPAVESAQLAGSEKLVSLPLRSLPRELWWLIRESFRSGMGDIRRGIRQIRWEEQARGAIYELLNAGVDAPIETAGEGVGEKAWPATS